jgi:hypothetical protein
MPRIWEGCNLSAWLRLLARNHFAVSPRLWPIGACITAVSSFNSSLSLLQSAWFGSAPDRAPIPQPPLFILGHWRTGTTLLHELLILDERHTFPTTYECLAPNHFLLTGRLLPGLLFFLVPSRRPMDNMPAGWDRPQEDEFALCMLGQPSPYLSIAFPNHPPQDQEAFDLEGLSPGQKARWKTAFVRFLRHLSSKDPRRLVLKSPTHTWRIPTLLELFPGAQFVHIVRNPYVVFPSTVNLWRTLYEMHGMQVPNYRGLEENVFRTFIHMHERLEETRSLVPPGQFHELRYEDLTADPVSQLRLLYDNLRLEGFEKFQPRLEKSLQEQAGYRTNRYPQLPEELRQQIRQRWGAIIDRYGYSG